MSAPLKRSRSAKSGAGPVNKKAKGEGKSHGANPNNADNEEYVIIINNVEKNFGIIHEHLLATHCGLNPERSGTTHSEESHYVVKCRTETHSAEINFFQDPADPFSVFLHQRKKAPVSHGAEDPTAITEDVHGANTLQKGEHPVTSLPQLANKTRSRPYFGQHLQLHVSLPGYEEGELLLGKDSKTKDKKAPKAIVQQNVHQNDLVSCVARLTRPLAMKLFLEKFRDIPGFVSGWRLHAERVRNPDDVRRAKPNRSTNGMYKVVFQNKKFLFDAKNLLDQFELDKGVRVTLLLSDPLQTQVREYGEEKEAEE
ncbi:hypothetical protein ADEAN_000711800 [Angomonas deanei]|uniref:Uncharacterized protein n=1 Tax=Angomonas deanei TaxID=59799 RepID=A0A7G2CJP3_9TRYP|nr:hypothetical protein ADEAN_000711800 [Angomonas deanei]